MFSVSPTRITVNLVATVSHVGQLQGDLLGTVFWLIVLCLAIGVLKVIIGLVINEGLCKSD